MSEHGPIGYFVHHQGRGHAERAAAIANALIETRGVTLFCARDDIFAALDERIVVQTIPSLFEPTGQEAPAMAALPAPDTVHCAPLGWPSLLPTGRLVVRRRVLLLLLLRARRRLGGGRGAM